MKHKIRIHFAHLALATLAFLGSICFGQSPTDPFSSSFLSYRDRKARESELQGNNHLGVVSSATTVTTANGQKLPLPLGFVLKIVNEAYANRPDSFVGYITANRLTLAFSIPRSSVSLIRRNSPQWAQSSQTYQDSVDALEADLKAQAAAPQQRIPSPQPQLSALSKNDRARMLYVLRDDKFISSIRAGESIPDDQLFELYGKAMEQRRLRGIESAIRELQR